MRLVVSKAIQFVLSVLCASFLLFLIIQLTPGDMAEIHSLSPTTAAQYYLDKPILVQYFHWIISCLTLDFGVSFATGTLIGDIIWDYTGTSLILASSSLILSLGIALPSAIFLSRYNNSKRAKAVSTFLYSLSSIPVFVVGYILLAIVFGVFEFYPLDPPTDTSSIWAKSTYYLLPIIVLALGNGTLGEFVRVLHLEINQVKKSLYIKSAKSRGLLLLKHYIKPVLLPFLSIMVSRFAVLISGVVVIERIFNRRGLGWLTWEATLNRDFFVILSVTLLLAILIRALMFLQELLIYWLDPRIRSNN